MARHIEAMSVDVIAVEPSSPTPSLMSPFLLDPSSRTTQMCCVARHAERADAAYALYKGAPYVQSEEYREHPWDPPLSDDGERGALDLAAEIKHVIQKHETTIHVVVTSPYLRCTQTASVICRELGPSTILMFDASCGEIFGKDIFGPTQPERLHRDFSSVLEDCKARGVTRIAPLCVGAKPQWPETLQDGRQRFNETFLAYVHRGTEKMRNFLVVTHGDCVAAAGTLLPGNQDIAKVHPGAVLMAQRLRPIGPGPGDTWSMMSSERSDDKRTEKAVLKSLSRSQGWKVESANIDFCSTSRTKESVMKRMVASFRKFTARSKLGEDRVKNLMKAFSGDRRRAVNSVATLSPVSAASYGSYGSDPALWIFSCEEGDNLSRMPCFRPAWIKASGGRRSPTRGNSPTGSKSPRSPHKLQVGHWHNRGEEPKSPVPGPKTLRSLIAGNHAPTGSTITQLPFGNLEDVDSSESKGSDKTPKTPDRVPDRDGPRVSGGKKAYLQLPVAGLKRGGGIKDMSSSPLWRRRQGQNKSESQASTTMSLVEVMNAQADRGVSLTEMLSPRDSSPLPLKGPRLLHGGASWQLPMPPQEPRMMELPNCLPDELDANA